MDGKGLFITLEGIDGCGKTTQAALLCDWLSEVLGAGNVLRTFEPGGWSGGELLRGLLLGEYVFTSRTELLLFLADRSGHVDTEIAPALQSGRCVVCERYTDSTLAYQSWGRGIPSVEMDALLNWCRFPVPDITVLLDMDEAAAEARLKRRGKADRIETAGDGFSARVALGYRELAKLHPKRVVTVDAAGRAEDVAERVRRAVAEKFQLRFFQFARLDRKEQA